MERLAPAPRIRVGVSRGARAVRLTSSSPFRVGAPGRFVETQDVVIEPVAAVETAGAVYRLQLRSFPTRARAAAFRSSTLEELEHDELSIWRESQSARFAVRLGNFSTAAGAEARLRDLVMRGFENVGVVQEPARQSPPRELVLRPMGQAVMSSPVAPLFALPRAEAAWIEVDGVPYRGYIEVLVNRSNTFTVVNVVNLEDYLKGVVPAELSPRGFPEKEAIKAQTIAARTYAVKRLGQFESEGYDICATPACQVYRGVSIEHPMATEAVRETAGEVLTHRGRLVDALYTSTCGGRTENAESIFSGPQPYLVSRACFLEPRGETVRGNGSIPLSLEAATLDVLQVADASRSEAPVPEGTFRAWMERAVTELGQTPCWESPPGAGGVDTERLSNFLGEGLCWKRRLPFLISSEDALRVVPASGLPDAARRYLAYAIQEDIVTPPADGIAARRTVPRAELLATLFRLIVTRGEPPLKEGTLRRIENGRLFLTDETLDDEDNEISTFLGATPYLFRRAGASTYYSSELSLLPGDTVLFHMGDGGIDVLVLVSEGASFDRSSRLSHWVVRTKNEDLSREMNLRHAVGDILDLRPKRYGRSGRIIELSVIGTSGTAELKGLEVRRALGIRENLFILDAQKGPDGKPAAWVFSGRGWGHGVGMCQVGAFGMAAAGYTYDQILTHYYTGTKLERR